MTTDAAARLCDLAGVTEAVAAAREACEKLRWHPAMRRRSAQVRAEATIWQAWASATLDGARLPLEVVRAAGVGAHALPQDPVGDAVGGALRAAAEADRLAEGGGRLLRSAPRQALARLHLAAAEGLTPTADLGRPRTDSSPAVQTRLGGVLDLLAGGSTAPAAVVAAIVQAEVTQADFFVGGNGVTARALARALSIGLGLDPMGAAVPEFAMVTDQQAYQHALAGYASATADGVGHWLRYYAGCVVSGAEHGRQLADSVLVGRPIRLEP